MAALEWWLFLDVWGIYLKLHIYENGGPQAHDHWRQIQIAKTEKHTETLLGLGCFIYGLCVGLGGEGLLWGDEESCGRGSDLATNSNSKNRETLLGCFIYGLCVGLGGEGLLWGGWRLRRVMGLGGGGVRSGDILDVIPHLHIHA
jgi:hypothetical protein